MLKVEMMMVKQVKILKNVEDYDEDEDEGAKDENDEDGGE